VLRYAAFGVDPVRAQSWIVWRWLQEPACWVTACLAWSLYFEIGRRA